jgi:hypothetical protein
LSSAQRPPSRETLCAIMMMSSLHSYLSHVECVGTLVRLLLSAVNRIDESHKSASGKLLAPASRVTESSARPRGSCRTVRPLSVHSVNQRRLKTTSVHD